MSMILSLNDNWWEESEGGVAGGENESSQRLICSEPQM